MKKLIVTFGPALKKDPSKLGDLDTSKYLFRINGAHGTPEIIAKDVQFLREQMDNPDILIDFPGNKVRTADLGDGIELKINETFAIATDQLNYGDFYKFLKVGQKGLSNDSTFEIIVEDISKEGTITFRSFSEGVLLSNKGMHVNGVNKDLPFLFKKDLDLIKLSEELNVAYVGLSFVRNANDIREVKSLLGDATCKIISKVETASAVEDLANILKEVEYILVDRGDLSTDVGLNKVPFYQKYIIDKANFFNKKTFLATQFLKNMEDKPIPTIAEVIDLYNTLKSGVYGIQLSEETAVGKYPYKCINLFNQMLDDIYIEKIGK